MNDIGHPTEAERRLSGALDRLEQVLAGPGSAAELALKLAEEQAQTAQLNERLRALKIELAEMQQTKAIAPPPPPPSEDHSATLAERDAELAEVRAALEAATLGIESQLDALRNAHAQEIAALKADMDGAAAGYAETLAAKDAEIAAAKAATPATPAAPASSSQGDLAALTALSDITAELRASAARGAAEPDLINRSMEAELEASRIARHADLAEMRALLAELEPMLEESANA